MIKSGGVFFILGALFLLLGLWAGPMYPFLYFGCSGVSVVCLAVWLCARPGVS